MCTALHAQTPVINSLTPSSSYIYLGGSVTITPTFTLGTGSISGIGAVSSGATYTVTPTTTTTYTLTVVGSGTVPTYARQSVTITVATASLTAAKTSIYTGTSTTLTPIFATGQSPAVVTATISPAIPGLSGPLVSGNQYVVSPTTTTTYTMTITGGVPNPMTKSVTIGVSAPPQPIITFATNSSIVYATVGDKVTIPAVSNYNGSGFGTVSYSSSNNSIATVNTANGAVVTLNVGSSLITANQAAALGYNAQASTSYNLSVVAAPVATSLNTNATAIYAGQSAILTPNFSKGTGSVNTVGAVISGNSYTVTPAVTTNYVLTVVNLANRVATTTGTQVTVYPAPVLSFAKTSGVYVTLNGTTTDTLTTSLSGNSYGAIAYTSNNSLTAAVNTTNGLVTGCALGTAVITANQALKANVNASASQSFTVTVIPAPVITSLNASASSILVGGSSSITPVFSNGIGSIATLGTVTSNTAYTVYPLTTTNYTLSVTNLAGTTVTRPVTINVATTPVLTFLRPTFFSLSPGSTFTNSASSSLSGGSYGAITYSSSNTAIATVNATTGAITAVAPGYTTITASQAAAGGFNSSSSQSSTLQVVPSPVITSFTASSSSLIAGASTRLTPVFSNGTGTINTLGTVYSGTSYTVAPSASTTYTLTVTNSALAVSSTVTQSLPITVNAIPIPTLAFNQTYPVSATSFSLGAFSTFTNTATTNYTGPNYGIIKYSSSNTAVASVDQLTGVVTTYLQGTVTITATQVASVGYNAAVSKSYNITVVANPIAQSLVSTRDLIVGQQGVIIPSFLNGTGYIAGIGTVVSGQAYVISPTASTTYTLIVTNSLGRTATASATTTVIPLASPTLTFIRPTAVTLSVGDTLLNTALSTSPGINYGGVTYVSSNTSVATVGSGSGLVTASTVGTTTITATQAARALWNNSATGSYTVTVVNLPVASSITLGSNTVVLGTSTTITPVFTGGTATLTGVTGTITSGTSYTITPTSSAYYFLTVTNAAGAKSTKLLYLTVTPPPAGTISFATGSFNLTQNATATNVATASLTGSGFGAITYSTSNTAIATVNSTTGAVTGVSPGSAIITATQLASVGKNSYSSQSYAVNVIAAPVITSFVAGSSSLIQGQSTTVVGVFSGGTATLTNTTGPIYTGHSYTIYPTINGSGPPGTAVYTLSVTNIANTTVTQNVNIALAAPVVPTIVFNQPSISDLPANQVSVTGGSVTFVTLPINATCNVVPQSTIAGYFTFTSSNAAVATVDPNTGLVTAIAPGSAIITTNVTLSYGTYSKSYTVNVATSIPAAPQVTSVITGVGSVQVNFTSPLYATLPAITHYTVTAIPSGGGSVLTTTVNAPCTSIVLNGLNVNTSYSVIVKASNYTGSGTDTGLGSSSIATLISTYVPNDVVNGSYIAVGNTRLPLSVSTAWATGTISLNTLPTSGDVLKWINGDQVYWTLIPNYTSTHVLSACSDLTALQTLMNTTSPIYTAGTLVAVGAPGVFTLIAYNNVICGFVYQGQYYTRTGYTQPYTIPSP